MNKGLIGGLVALGLIGVTAGVCVGVPQIRNEIVGIYHDVEDKVNDTDLKNEISNLESKLNELKEKYNSSLENFNLLKLEKENLENQIEEIQANNELTLSEKNALISSLNEQLEEKKLQIETLTTQNSEYLLEIQELEEELENNKINISNVKLSFYMCTVGKTVFEKSYINKPIVFNDFSYTNVGFVYEQLGGVYSLYLVSYKDGFSSYDKIGLLSDEKGNFIEKGVMFDNGSDYYQVIPLYCKSLNDNVVESLDLSFCVKNSKELVYFGGYNNNCDTSNVVQI